MMHYMLQELPFRKVLLLEVALRSEKFDYYGSEKLQARLRQIKAEVKLEKDAKKQ